MAVDITEFIEMDPTAVHAVFKAANGTEFLMIKQVGDEDDDKDDKDDKPDDAEKGLFDFCGDQECEVCISRASKGKLSMAERRQIPKSDFALPEKAPGSGSYPIKDRAHARAALRMRGHASPEDQARIKRAVASKYPDLGKGKKGKKKKAAKMDSQQSVEQSFHGMLPSTDSAQGQTKKNKRGLATNKDVQSDRPSGKPKIPDTGSIPQEGTGFGRTASAQGAPVEKVKGQTSELDADEDARQAASKETVDIKGSTLEDAKGESTDVKPDADGAQSQTMENMRRNQPTGGDAPPGQAMKGGFKFKLKKKGKKKNKKKAPYEMSGALKSGPERVLSVAHATKEFENMTGAELAETFASVLDARDARKAAERKAKKKAAKKKAEKKARKAGATTPGVSGEAAQEAAKSISPEALVEGIGARLSQALKEEVAPLWGRMQNLEQQPARSRPALNDLAGKEPVMRDQRRTGGNPMDVFKPLEEAFKSEADPQKKERIGNQLTKAKLVVAERIRHGQVISAEEARSLVPAAQ